MPRLLVKIANIAWLVIIFIGVPAITHAQFGHWDVTPESTARMLIFWGLVLGLAANVLMATTFKKRKDQTLGWEWVAAFAGLLIVEFAYTHGYLNFNWLKESLQWLQSKF